MREIKRILVTGGTGYVGNNLTKMLAALHPKVEILSMSRQSPDAQRHADPYKSRFRNIQFIQGDCLHLEDSVASDAIARSDAVIHTVGALLDESSGYKQIIQDVESGNILNKVKSIKDMGVVDIAKNFFNEFQKQQGSVRTTTYEQSLEALNRDSLKNVAKVLADSVESKDEKKNLVFISAEPSVMPMLQKYSETKKEAEEFLLEDQAIIENLARVILRPGMIWHNKQRQWAMPLKVANDIGYKLNKEVV
mmetsp:Transcript_33426/g.51310  ORF Transcript_33426/g.51310 Transcript_33426/m.51310 type:complete len:250 (+) Transcript_33426:14-763(+)